MSSVVITGLDRLQKHLSTIANPRQTFDKDFAKVARQSVRILIEGTPKKTGTTARGWSAPLKIRLSDYRIENVQKGGGPSIARILDSGRREVRPVNAKMLYIPISNKGRSRKAGAPIPKGFVYGVDYVFSRKSRAIPGTRYMTKEIEAAGHRLGAAMTATVRGIHNGR